MGDWVKATKLLKSEDFLPVLTTVVSGLSLQKLAREHNFPDNVQLIEGAHWFHIENPKPFNAALRSWLEKITATQTTDAPKPRVVDEL